MCFFFLLFFFFFQAEDGIRDLVRSRGLGDVYKRQGQWGAQLTGRAGLGGIAGFCEIAGLGGIGGIGSRRRPRNDPEMGERLLQYGVQESQILSLIHI